MGRRDQSRTKQRHWERGPWLGRATLLRKHLSGSPWEVRKVALEREGSFYTGRLLGTSTCRWGSGGSEEQPGGHCGQGLGWGQWSLMGGSPAHHSGRGCLQPRERLVDGSTKYHVLTEEQGRGRTAGCSAPGARALPTLCQVKTFTDAKFVRCQVLPLAPSFHLPCRPTR